MPQRKTAKKKPAAKKAAKKAVKKKVATKKTAAKKATGRPKGSGKKPVSPDHAPTVVKLAEALGRDQTTISEWKHKAGCPGTDKTGQYHVPTWEKWIEESGLNFKDNTSEGKNARARLANAKAELEELKVKRQMGEVGDVEEILQVMETLCTELSNDIQQFWKTHSERLAGQEAGALEKIGTAKFREILKKVTEIPDEKKKSSPFWNNVAERLLRLQRSL